MADDRQEAIERTVRRVHCDLLNAQARDGDGPRYDAAIAAIEALRVELTPVPLDVYAISVGDAFGIRVGNALEEYIGVRNIGEFLSADISKLRSVPNLGVVSFGAMHAILYYHKLGHCAAALALQRLSFGDAA